MVAARARAEGLTWADPAARAHEGRQSRTYLEAAAAAIATALGAPDARVVFLPGGQVALWSAVAGVGHGPAVTSAVDRQVVLAAAAARTAAAGQPATDPLAVDDLGRLVPTALAAALEAPPGLVVLQVGNPEVGTMQPLAQVHPWCLRAGVPLLLDATMAAGRVALPDAWDAIVLDARSWAGGDDVGVLVLRPGVRWSPPPGSGEVALRPLGAPSVAACAAAALGLEQALRGLPDRIARDVALTDRLRSALADLPDVAVHGDARDRLPHVVGCSALYVDAEALLLELDRADISVASGSACAAASGQASHVLAAMGALTSGNVRITLPMGATVEDIDRLLAVLPGIIGRMRAEAGL